MSGAPRSGAGTYTVLAAFPGSTDYAAAAGLADFRSARRRRRDVDAPGGAYSGPAFGGSATVTAWAEPGGTSLEGVPHR